MRVIAGRYRGKRLTAPSDEEVRPTTDRIKETVFNVLQWKVPSARVLDLFCGSGALGIECLSRGAREVIFVDRSRDSVSLTRLNLKGIEGSFRVVASDFLSALRSTDGKFDIVFIDPPFASGLGETAVETVIEKGLLAEGGVIVYEHTTARRFALDLPGYKTREKIMGSVTVDFISKKTTAMVTGSFDPVTKGHEYLIDEAARRFDEVIVACLNNPEKNYLFTPEERLSMLNAAIEGKPNVRALYSEAYAADVARENGVDALVRGIRGEADSAYEREMAEFNRGRGFETVFIEAENREISSGAVKEQMARGDFHSLPSGAIMIAREIMKRKAGGDRR